MRRRRLKSASAVTTASRLVFAPLKRMASCSSPWGISMVVFMRQIWPSPGFSSRAIQNPKVVADTTLRGLRWAMPGCVCGQAVGRPRSASAAGGETHGRLQQPVARGPVLPVGARPAIHPGQTAGDETHAAFGRRSIPADRVASRRSSLRFGRNTPGIPPSRALSAGRLAGLGAHAGSTTGCYPRRCAPLIVAFRSKYTRASSPGGGSSLTRLVSRAPRPHRENWPASALTRVSPQAASRARGTVADPRRWPGSRRGRPFRRAGERGVCPQIAPGPSTPRTPGGDRWRPGEATGRGRPRRPFEKRAPRRPGGSALPPPPRHHSPGHRAGLRAVHVPAWDQGPPGQPPGQASHDQGSRLVRLPAATGVPPDWFSTLKMDYFGDAFVRQRRGPLIESGVCQRGCLLVRVFERAAKGFLAPMAKLSPYRLQHKAAPVARLAIDFKNHGFGKGDGDALHHKNLTLSMRMPPRSIESAGTCRSERPHLPPSHVPHSPADE